MAEKDFGILEQYDCKLYSVARGRGAFICETDKGTVLLREYTGKEEKLNSRAKLLSYLWDKGLVVDYYLPNRDGTYLSRDANETCYTLSYWFKGRECDVKNTADLCQAMNHLARLHQVLAGYEGENSQEFQIARSLLKEYDKHNKELKTIRNYLNGRRHKTDFELLAQASCPDFLREGMEAGEKLGNCAYETEYAEAVRRGKLTHGAYNYHNIYFKERTCELCGFEQAVINLQLADIYAFMRKLLEKYNYDIELGYLLINEYNKVRSLSFGELEILGAMFAYPEKYWKVLNFYYNGNKAWIPARNLEKLKLIVEQNEKRREFIKTIIN